jgi:hypothetical protein
MVAFLRLIILKMEESMKAFQEYSSSEKNGYDGGESRTVHRDAA